MEVFRAAQGRYVEDPGALLIRIVVEETDYIHIGTVPQLIHNHPRAIPLSRQPPALSAPCPLSWNGMTSCGDWSANGRDKSAIRGAMTPGWFR
jgi:hypothetical protein